MQNDPKPEVLLAAILAKETRKRTAYKSASDATMLCRLGRRAAKIALDRCNGIMRWDAKLGRQIATWTEADDARADKSARKIEAQAREILKIYGATNIRVGGDPRGYTLKFKLKSGASNTLGDGWGV